MSVENSTTENEGEKKAEVNGSKSENANGLQNGYTSSEKHKSSHKSSSKDKHRDKERDHKSSKHSSSSSKDKDKHSSSKSHHHSSSHKSSSKDKDKERSDKDRSDRDKSHKDKHRDKERSDKDKHKSDKDKEKSEKDKEKSDKDKHHSSSHKSSSKDKDREHKSHSSSKDKEHKSKDKDRHKSDKDKDRSKDKERHSSSKDKHRDKDREKSSHSSSKDKHREIEKEEDPLNGADVVIKNEESGYDANQTANITASSCDYSLSLFKDEPKEEEKLEPKKEIKIELKKELKVVVEKDVKMEVDSEEDIPLSDRKGTIKRKVESDSDEEKPLTVRKKEKKMKKRDSDYEEDDNDSDEEPKKKKLKKEKSKDKSKKHGHRQTSDTSMKTASKKSNQSNASIQTPQTTGTKRKKKGQEDEPEVWKWWEEDKKSDGTKWKYLEHKGPMFAPPYEPLPKNVVFRYNGKSMHLSEGAEEVAGFYARMLDHDYTTKDVFNNNFFKDWRSVMTSEEKAKITDLKKCDFKEMQAFFQAQTEKNKNRTKEEKLALKEKNEEIVKEYGFCTIDGHKEKIGNFRIEPPGLFRGRGEHPKMGMLKKRIRPEDVVINCSRDSCVPKAPSGHRWKEVKHDNSVTWLASWTENVQGQVKYVMLNPSSKLKGEKDWQKYETARKLHKSIDKIRNTYRDEWKAKEMRIRQRAVALYFIDRLALRAGNEKDEDQADTVGCCSLRVEHIELFKEKDGKDYVVVFDFLGKDSIRYYNEVPVEKRVFKNLELFRENKKEGDDLFDRLTTQTLNEHLKELMPGLTAKVFRTYNASITLQNQLDELTDSDMTIPEKILAYNRANRAVAVLCNHQRAVPKGHDKSMEALKEKIKLKRDQIEEAESELRDSMKSARRGSVKEKLNADKKSKALDKLREALKKLELQETDRDENKSIALGTSKLNYLDPRISVAWCKKHGVPLEKIYNKTQRDKFRWAIDMADEDYVF